MGVEVVGVLEAQACGQGAIAVDGGEDGGDLEGGGGGVPEGADGGRQVSRRHG